MWKHVLAACVVVVCSLGIAFGETIKGVIVKIDGNKITVKDKKDTKDYEAAANCKVCKMDKKNKVEIAGGLKAEDLKDLGKGKPATLEVDGGKVVEIIIGGAKKDKN